MRAALACAGLAARCAANASPSSAQKARALNRTLNRRLRKAIKSLSKAGGRPPQGGHIDTRGASKIAQQYRHVADARSGGMLID